MHSNGVSMVSYLWAWDSSRWELGSSTVLASGKKHLQTGICKVCGKTSAVSERPYKIDPPVSGCFLHRTNDLRVEVTSSPMTFSGDMSYIVIIGLIDPIPRSLKYHILPINSATL